MKIKGRSLELFFVDGRPDGMLTAEVFNWTGHVLRIPRTQIVEGLKRSETARTGIYILLGTKGDGQIAYIGEAENLKDRIKGHIKGKDWWDESILVSTSSDSLHKAHVKYLESRLVEIAGSVGVVNLENANIPPRSSLSEAAQASMESFLETLNIVLPAIRVDVFLNKARVRAVGVEERLKSNDSGPLVKFRLNTPKHGVTGEAVLQDGELIVQAGSRGRANWSAASASHNYKKMHRRLIEAGTLEIDGAHSVFKEDYAFSSPSAAAAILNGRASNGRTNWQHVDSGMTFAEWEQEQVNQEDS